MELEARTRHFRPGWLSGKILVGGVIVAVFVICAIFAPLIAPYDPLEQNLLDRLASPSAAHPLGTDALGRDALSRLIFAARTDLPLAVILAVGPMLIGSALGLIAGFYGGFVDRAVSGIADAVQTIPIYVFMLVVVFALGPGEESLIIAFLTFGWIVFARLMRGEVLQTKNLDYVQAAVSGGLSTRRILGRHIVPNSIVQTIVYLPANMTLALVVVGSFSFLGLGIQPPTPEWGTMIAESRTFIQSQWWLITAPGIALATLGAGLLLVADGLDDRLRGK